MQLCAQSHLPAALQEAVRWWSRRGCAFPLLSFILAFHGGLRAVSGHAADEPLAPSKPPVPWASPAGSFQVGWSKSCFGALQQFSVTDRAGSGTAVQSVLHPCRQCPGSWGTQRECSNLAVTLLAVALKGADTKEMWCSSSVVGIAERGVKESADELAGEEELCQRDARWHTQTCSLSFPVVVSAPMCLRELAAGTGGELEGAGAVQGGCPENPFRATELSCAHCRAGPVAGTSSCCSRSSLQGPSVLGSSSLSRPGSLSRLVSLTLSCLHSRVFQTSPSRGGSAARTPASWTLTH